MYKLIYLARRNPNATRAEWPDLWRSHATFAGQFPALRAGIKWSRYCNRIDEVTHGVSTAHDGVAVCLSDNIEVLQFGCFNKKQRALVDCDELRVFDRLTGDFSWHCVEEPVREGVAEEAAVFRFLVGKPEMARVDFRDRLLTKHAQVARDTIAPLSAITRYIHNMPLHEPPHPLFPFEAIIESWYTSADEAVRSLAKNQLAPIEQDLKEFCDVASGVVMMTKVARRNGSSA
jgi:hypothetical protein